MTVDSREAASAHVPGWWRRRVWPFVATGVLAALIGVWLFYGGSLVVLLTVFATGLLGKASGNGDAILLLTLGLFSCVICFFVPWLVGSLRFARYARWACPVAYLVVWLLHAPVVYMIVQEAGATPVFFLLLANVGLTFAGGDLGDRRRWRRQMQAMAAEAAQDDQALRAELLRTAGWIEAQPGASAEALPCARKQPRPEDRHAAGS